MGFKAVETPIKSNLKLQPAKANEVIDKDRFPRLVGRLIYLSHTRPDIAIIVNMVSQFIHSPGQHHFDAICKLLRYLKGTPEKGLLFEDRGHLEVEVYTNAD